jgi:hypothetical protein
MNIPLGRVKNGCSVFPSPPCMFITAAMDVGRAVSECCSPRKQDSRLMQSIEAHSKLK